MKKRSVEPDYHRQKNPTLEIEQVWLESDITILDVRSPREFMEGSIPAAFNLPLLDNEERSAIGVLYRHCGRGAAIEEGYDLLKPKIKQLEHYFAQYSKSQRIVVYCARGGMRSNVITSLMRSFGYDAYQLTGGYKRFRNWLLQRLETFTFKKLIILQGVTGVGKTLVLNRLKNSIDLENLAQHRGSLFGGIGKVPEKQKNFEANLLLSLDRCDQNKTVFMEGESRKIGTVSIPGNIHRQMKEASVYLLEASIEVRAARTVEEYITKQIKCIPQIREKIKFLTKELGHKKVTHLISLYDRGNYLECFKGILLDYYDSRYKHSMGKLRIKKVISAEDIALATEEIKNEVKI